MSKFHDPRLNQELEKAMKDFQSKNPWFEFEKEKPERMTKQEYAEYKRYFEEDSNDSNKEASS